MTINFRVKSASAIIAGLVLITSTRSVADILEFEGNPEALSHQKYVNVVSEVESPIEEIFIKSKDGMYIAAALRKPSGEGPFPAIIMFHGSPGGRGIEQLVGWSRGDHGGPVWERFLQEGYVVVVADYRGGSPAIQNSLNTPSTDGIVSAIDDGVAVIDYVQELAFVNRSKINVYGVSLGGNLAMYLASKVPTLHSVVVGAPYPIWFLGATLSEDGRRPDFTNFPIDFDISRSNVEPIQPPIYILAGTVDPLLPVSILLHDELEKYGKDVRLEIYEHGYHDFVLGPQGHNRRDLPNGEFLLQGALDALEKTVRFVATDR